MGLLERMKSLIRANIKEILQRAEDPERKLDDLIQMMQADLAEARAGVAGALRDERHLRDSCHYHQRQAEEMLERATSAARTGNDDLAREALRRRLDGQRTAADLQAQCGLQQRTLAELQESLAALENKIAQARREKEALLARRRLARARRGVQQASANGPLSSGRPGFERLSDEVDELVAEVEAYEELAKGDVPIQLERLERQARADDAIIEDELGEIKRRLDGQG